MKEIQLTKGKVALVDDEDYERLNQYKWYCSNTDKAVRMVSKTRSTVLMHRVIMDCTDSMVVDHKDGDGLNNRKDNLRICTQIQNQGNSKLGKNNTSGIKGVSWNKNNKKWSSYIKINYKKKHLGYFIDINEAKNAYIKAAKDYFGEYYFDGIRS